MMQIILFLKIGDEIKYLLNLISPVPFFKKKTMLDNDVQMNTNRYPICLIFFNFV